MGDVSAPLVSPHEPAVATRARWVVPLLLFLGVLTVFALTATRSTVSLDAWSANLASWRIATAGTATLEDIDVPELENHAQEHTWVVEDEDGNRTVGRAPGVIAAALPAYWIAQPDEMDLAPAAFTAALLSAIAVLLFYLTLAHRMARREAVLAALVFGLATPVWSISANAVWPHTLTVLGITGMAWAASRERWWLVGVFGGVALWGRLHAAIIVAVLGLAVALVRRSPRIAMRAALSSGGLLLLSCLWNQWMYDSWSPAAAYETSRFVDYAGSNRLSITNQLGLWVSPDRGILVWTPLLVLLAPALVRSWRTLPDWSRWLLLGGLAYTLVQTTLNRFSGGDTFYGYRIGLEFLAAAAPAVALSARRMSRTARLLFGPVVAAQCCMILTGAVNEAYFVGADRVWVDNAFLVAMRSNPTVMPLILVACVLAGFLGQRIWQDPGLRTSRATQEGTADGAV